MSKTRAILADVEGTTTSVAFVHEVLFPYAARELPAFVRSGAAEPDVARLLEDTARDAGEPGADTERCIEILQGWMAEDRKATPLKALQGLVWERGYARGDFTGHVYPDVPAALRRWREREIAVFIYSSGSVKAQQLLFGHSDAGDLRPLIDGYFDTRVGHKREAGSYREIAGRIGLPASSILFLSDTAEELDAAAEAGMGTLQLLRGGTAAAGGHRSARTFDELARIFP